MNNNQNSSPKQTLSPQRIKEKADILETNLYKAISKQENQSKMQFSINRKNFPDPVIQKALLQLMPRFNVKPRDFLLGLRDLLNSNIGPDKEEIFEKTLTEEEDTLYTDTNVITRTFKASAAQHSIEIIVKGVAEKKSCDGKIAKSFFNHEKSPGKLSKDGIINFKEINNYPIVNADDNLFYITYEKQGTLGLAFDGKIIHVPEAVPYAINIGPSIERIEDESGTDKTKGYFLKAKKTGVVTLERNQEDIITSIDISEEVEIKKLDYSTGNIGSLVTCPIQMKVGVVCNGFKIRVHGKVQVNIVDGGEVITNNCADIMKAQGNSTIMALKDITIDSISHSKIISEQGCLNINTELIDSQISAPEVIFERSKGLITNNKIESENITFNGLYFSGENIIHFGNNLFVEKKELQESKEKVHIDTAELKNNEKVLMGKLQLELKRLTKLATTDSELIKFIKPLIIATQTMDFEIINREMELIQKRNNTKVVANVKNIFEHLEKLPQSIKGMKFKKTSIDKSLNQIEERMASMKLSIEGFLRRAATIKVFCGSMEDKENMTPDFIIESESVENKLINITGTYSAQNGFEFAQ